MKMTALDSRLNRMTPGQILFVSGTRADSVWTTAERSGDGKRLTFVRHTETTSTVVNRCDFF